MALAPLDELRFLTEALKAHIEWTKATGSNGLPACDATWLEARRDHYRRTPYIGEDAASDAAYVDAAARNPTEIDFAAAGPAPARGELRAATEGASPAVTPPTPLAPSLVTASAVSQHAGPSGVTPVPGPPLPDATKSETAAPSHAGVEVAKLVNPMTEATSLGKPPPAVVRVDLGATSVNSAHASNLSLEERHARLTVLENQARECRACSLCETRTNAVFARGNGSVGVAFVGEGPGADEDAQGYPFVGAAGQLLDKMIAAMGLDRESVYVCNIVKCRPPNNRKPTEEEMAACRHYVVSQLDLIKPRVIVALGASAVEGLLGLKLGITRLRGTWRLYNGSIPVMPTFHPAYLLRQPDAKREVWDDLQAVLTRINMPLPQRRK